MLEWMIMPLRRYADFKGRSRRKEFWLFALLNVVVFTLVTILSMVIGGASMMTQMANSAGNPMAVYGALFSGVGLLLAVWWLATVVPNVAVGVRRLHDRDMSGWWYLGGIVGGFIPFVGILASIGLVVLFCLEGARGPNRFGPDPKGPAHQDVFA